MRELDARHLGHAELARRQHAAVAGDDAVLAVDQYRVGEAKLADAAGDLRDLGVAVSPRVARDRARLPSRLAGRADVGSGPGHQGTVGQDWRAQDWAAGEDPAKVAGAVP